MIIREANIEDAKSIAKISSESLGYPCDEKLVERRLSNLYKQKVFVVEEDEEIVGFVQAELYQLLYQENSINVLGLAIHKDFQIRGYGKALMLRVEEWAKEMSCSKVRLNSEISRLAAHCFYESLGYKNTKSQKRFEKKI
ncbi:MAG: GNAT family N-acetyltransferase [Erysipelotrichaceae bacterium]|nr:GNAT family N-acetyltransferase [Erysipelotrichaceae bacterium]